MIRCAYCDSRIDRAGVCWAGEPYHGPCLDFIATAAQRQAEVELAALESRNRVETVMPYRPEARRSRPLPHRV